MSAQTVDFLLSIRSGRGAAHSSRTIGTTACFSVVPRLAVLVLSDDIAYENQKVAYANAEFFLRCLTLLGLQRKQRIMESS